MFLLTSCIEISAILLYNVSNNVCLVLWSSSSVFHCARSRHVIHMLKAEERGDNITVEAN